jgi:ribosomal protein S4
MHISKQEQRAKVVAYRKKRQWLARELSTPGLWARTRRRFFFHQAQLSTVPALINSTLRRSRTEILARRVVLPLHRRIPSVMQAFLSDIRYNYPNRRATEFVTNWTRRRFAQNDQFLRHYAPVTAQSPVAARQLVQRRLGGRFSVGTLRAVTQLRRPEYRSVAVHYKTKNVIPTGAFVLNSRVSRRIRRIRRPLRQLARINRRAIAASRRFMRRFTKSSVGRFCVNPNSWDSMQGVAVGPSFYKTRWLRRLKLAENFDATRGRPTGWSAYQRRRLKKLSLSEVIYENAFRAAGTLPKKHGLLYTSHRLRRLIRACKKAEKYKKKFLSPLLSRRRFRWYALRAPAIVRKWRFQRKQSAEFVSYSKAFPRSTTRAVTAQSALFNLKGGEPITRAAIRLRVCTRLSRQKVRLFDRYRTVLWNRLTLRWMKRYRIGRYWLKNTSLWMRDPWIASIVSLNKIKPDKFGGELQNVEQQVGEYVAPVDSRGKDILASEGDLEREELSVRPQPRDMEAERIAKARAQGTPLLPIAHHRLAISNLARKKPIPALWLANHECKVAVAAAEKERNWSKEERVAAEAERIKNYWAHKEACVLARHQGRTPPKQREVRAPLKYPANYWLPHLIWKDVQRRIRRFEWRESDEVFFRPGFRNAFSLHPKERRQAPWLQPLLYNRSTYSTRLHEFRRWQFPREQKKYKWLQRVRKSLAPCRKVRYFKWRRWPQLRRYNQKLFYSLFNLPDRRAASRHFRKLNKRSAPVVSNFIRAQKGLGTRLDVTLMHLGVAPSIYWARTVAPFGLLRVNGVRLYRADDQLHPGDMITLEWSRIHRFQHYFRPLLNAREAFKRPDHLSTGAYPTNFEYHCGTRTLVYRHAPEEADLRTSNRLQGNLFRWFKLDSV